MNKTCVKWKDQLLEAALGQKPGNELNAHLSQCRDCAAELDRLRARREGLDALLPLIGSAEPATDLTQRILTSARTAAGERAFLWRRWMIAGAAAVIVIAAITGLILNRRANAPDPALTEAAALAHWQAPTDILLHVPNHEFLNSVPKLDDSYLAIPVEIQKGERQ